MSRNNAEGTRRDSVVIIPMYNEKENAAAIIEAVLALPHGFDILVVDDNSPDGTATIVRSKMEEHPGRVHIIERAGKLGLGTAYITGFRYALDAGYDYIFEMDADFSHDPKDLERLYQACASGEMDVAVGSRYLTGVNVVNWPMGRVLMSYFASKYVRFVTGLDVHDTTAGFCCYRRQVLETMELDKIRFKGYAFQIEIHRRQMRLHRGRGADCVREPYDGHVKNVVGHLRRSSFRRNKTQNLILGAQISAEKRIINRSKLLQ